MKKLLLFLAAAFLSLQVASAQKVWTLKNIPNPHKNNYFIHVSNPDNILTDSTEKFINRTLNSIVKKADVLVVAVNSIGDEDTQEFRNQLFNYWKIGDAEKDNGLLMLFVEDQHKMEFETGYGLEGVLTDADCFAIYNQFMKPYFKEGEYDKGMYVGVTKIANKLGAEIEDTEPYDDEINWFYIIGCCLLFLCCVKWLFDLIAFLLANKEEKKKMFYNGTTYSLFRWPYDKAKEKGKFGFLDIFTFLGRCVLAIIGILLVQSIGVIFMTTSKGGSSSGGGGDSSGGSSGGGGYSGSW